MSRRDETLLMFADSERDADMLYAVGAFVSDPIVYLRLNGRPVLVMDDQSAGALRPGMPPCRLLSWRRLAHRARAANGRPPTIAAVIRELLRERRVKRPFVPPNFPHGLARQLRRLGVRVKLKDGAPFPQREIKSADEVKKISAALMMAEVGLAEAIQVLKNSKIGRNGQLLHHQLPLRAEKLQAVINVAILQAGGLPVRTVVVSGRQTGRPQPAGRTVLRANEPILIEVSPRSRKTGYYGDITRTVVRGRASEAVRSMYHSVVSAQETALNALKDGTPAAAVHRLITDFLAGRGYKAGYGLRAGMGCAPGTGHGLGLELREVPRLNALSQDVLAAGNVVTIEPGLFHPAHGAVRLEDVAWITTNGARNLTKFEKVLEI
jgi:Xaa-Pro aminopeptidase